MAWNVNLLTCHQASSNLMAAWEKLACLVFFVHIFVGKHKTSELQIVLINFTTKQAILHLPVGIIITSSSDKGMNTLKTHSLAFFSRFSCQQGPLVQSFHVKMFGFNFIPKNWDVDEDQNYIFFKIAVLLPKFGFFLSIFLLNFFMTLARRLPDTCQRLTRTLLTWHQKWGQKHARVAYLYILDLCPYI